MLTNKLEEYSEANTEEGSKCRYTMSVECIKDTRYILILLGSAYPGFLYKIP